MGNFSYTPHAILCGEFLLHAACYFVWRVSLTRPMLYYMGSFSYTPHAIFVGIFSCLPHASFSDTPNRMLYGGFLLHAPCYIMWGVSLTRPVLFYVGSFSYTPRALLFGEFLLHAPCCIMWGVSLTRPMLLLCEDLLVHIPHFCC